MSDAKPKLVLLHHAGRQPRGAWFDVAHRAVLTEAAAQPQHALLELDSVRIAAIAPDIAAGKLGPTGKPDPLPVMMAGPFEKLLELAKVGALVASGSPPSRYSNSVPAPWSAVVVGSVVLASDAADDGWWECVVVALEGHDTLRLRWRDFPDHDQFSRLISRVGLMPPGGQR